MAAVLVYHPANGDALHHAGGPLSRHREFQDVRHGQPVDFGRSRIDHGSCFDHLETRCFRGLAHGIFLGFRHHSFRHRLRPRQYLREGPQSGEAAMKSATAHISTAHSVVEPGAWTKRIAGAVVILYTLVTIIPLLWII